MNWWVPLAVAGPGPYKTFMLRRPVTGVIGYDGVVVRRPARKAPTLPSPGAPRRNPSIAAASRRRPGRHEISFVMTDIARALSPDPAVLPLAAVRRRLSPTMRPNLSPAQRRAGHCRP